MAKVLSCPSCGAPLSRDDDHDGVVECAYCKRKIELGSGGRSSPGAHPFAPAARQAESAPKSSTSAFVTAGVMALVMAGAIGAYFAMHPGAKAADPKPINVVAALNQLSLATDERQAAALFGLDPGSAHLPGQLSVDARDPGPIRNVHLTWYDADKRYISGLDVSHGPGARKTADILAKLRAFVPNRVRQGPELSIGQGDTNLAFSDRGFGVHHRFLHEHDPQEAGCVKRLNALFAIGRAAALDGPAPTPADLELVNGVTLERVGDVDPAVPIEKAVDFFQKKYSAGWCRMQGGLFCVVDPDDKLVDSVHFTWPIGVRSRVGQVKVELIREKTTAESLRAIAGCLEPALGPGEEKVIDYVHGTRHWKWKVVEESRSRSRSPSPAPEADEILLDGPMLLITSADGRPLDQPSPWHGKLRALFSALATCRLLANAPAAPRRSASTPPERRARAVCACPRRRAAWA